MVVRLDQEQLFWTADGEGLELTPDSAGAWQVWMAVLYLCVRDRATSLHYHSWREGDAFSYIVAGTRYTLAPPSPEVAEHLAAAWRERMPRGWWLRFRRAVWSTTAEACEVSVTVAGGTYDCYLVCWSLLDVVGVDLHFLSCRSPLTSSPVAEPGAAPGRGEVRTS